MFTHTIMRYSTLVIAFLLACLYVLYGLLLVYVIYNSNLLLLFLLLLCVIIIISYMRYKESQ